MSDVLMHKAIGPMYGNSKILMAFAMKSKDSIMDAIDRLSSKKHKSVYETRKELDKALGDLELSKIIKQMREEEVL